MSRGTEQLCAQLKLLTIPEITEMLTNMNKQKPLGCVTNTVSQTVKDVQKCSRINATLLMPQFTAIQSSLIYLQNKHPMLAMYKDDLASDDMTFAQLNDLSNMEHELKLLTFLQDIGIITKEHVCEFYGGRMCMAKQGDI